MFNTINYPLKTVSQTVRMDVHEHRAPTDDSLKLLREMEEKVKTSILSTFNLDNNIFSGSLIQSKNDLSIGSNYIFIAKLNGKDIRVEYSNDFRYDMQTNLQKLVEKVSHTLAVEIIQPALSTFLKQGNNL